jgi:hypothetical protein
MQNYFLNKNITLFFLLLSLSFLILRFFLPFFYYPQEDILIKYIFEFKGGSYLPLIHSYSNFTFSPSYSLENEFGNKNLAFPYLALFIPSILLKVFGPFSYIIIEFFATTLFLIIFYRILILLKFNNLSAIVISCFLFLLPSIIRELDYSINNEIISIVNSNVKSFYGLRVPRPLITNLYFFFFLLILIKIDKDKKYTIKRSLLMGVLVGLSIHALFLLALIEFFILLSYLILNYKTQIFKIIRKEIKFFFTLSIIVSFFLSLFVIHLYKISPDTNIVIGNFEINLEQKINLIKYTFKYLSNKFFLLLFITNIVLLLYIKKRERGFLIIFLSYLSSIITFLFFVVLVNRHIHYDLIQRTIFNTGILFFLLAIFKILDLKIKQFKNFKKIFFFLLITVFIFLNNYLYFKNFNKNDYVRHDFRKLVKNLEKENLLINKNDEILVLNPMVFKYLIRKDHQNFTIVPNIFWTTRSFENTENNLINTFKILGVEKDEFKFFFESKYHKFRLMNVNLSSFFGYKYLANSQKIYSKLNNYSEKEKGIIESTSPFVTQYIMPKDELNRILNKFSEQKILGSNPKLIIINKNDLRTKKHKIKKNLYCISYINRSFIIYKDISYCN